MTDKQATSPRPSGSGISIVRILTMLGVVLGIAGIGAGVMWFVNRDDGLMVTARGKVIWNGQPVTVGAVMSEHQENRSICPIGRLSEDGTFELLTNMQPGVPVGRYKLKIASFANAMPPVPLVPTSYTDFATSTLYVDVTRDPEKNVFDVILEGELAPQRGGGRPDAETESEGDATGESPQAVEPNYAEGEKPDADADTADAEKPSAD